MKIKPTAFSFPFLIVGILVIGVLVTKFAASSLELRSNAAVDTLTEQNITYEIISGKSLTLNICRPKTLTSPRPAVVMIHGGGWSTGDKSMHARQCEDFAKNGYIGVTIDYRLAPQFTYPAQLDDVQYAIRWLRANRAKYFIDQNRIIALGGSAGGTLAMLLGSVDTRNPSLGYAQYSSKVNAVISEFGIPDLSAAIYTPSHELYQYLVPYLGTAPVQTTADEQSSPYFRATAQSAPTLVIHGSNDTLVPASESVRYVNKLRQLRVPVYYIQFPGGHGIFENSSEYPWVFEQEISFVRSLFGPDTYTCTLSQDMTTVGFWKDSVGYFLRIPTGASGTLDTGRVRLCFSSTPVSQAGLPGSGDIQDISNLYVPGSHTLLQALWRNNIGYLRSFPVENGAVNLSRPGVWTRVDTASSLPGKGSIRAFVNYVYPNARTLLQAVWRDDAGYARTVPIGTDRTIYWDKAAAWSSAVPYSSLPGSGTPTAHEIIPYPNGSAFVQLYVRNGAVYSRTCQTPNGAPDWNRCSGWSTTLLPAALFPGNGTIRALNILPVKNQ